MIIVNGNPSESLFRAEVKKNKNGFLLLSHILLFKNIESGE